MATRGSSPSKAKIPGFCWSSGTAIAVLATTRPVGMLDANVATDIVGVQKLEGNLPIDLRGRDIQQRRPVAVAIQLHAAQIEGQVILAQIGRGSGVGQVVSEQRSPACRAREWWHPSPPWSVAPLAAMVKVAVSDPLAAAPPTASAMLLPSVPGLRATSLIAPKRGSNAAKTAGSPAAGVDRGRQADHGRLPACRP